MSNKGYGLGSSSAEGDEYHEGYGGGISEGYCDSECNGLSSYGDGGGSGYGYEGSVGRYIEYANWTGSGSGDDRANGSKEMTGFGFGKTRSASDPYYELACLFGNGYGDAISSGSEHCSGSSYPLI